MILSKQIVLFTNIVHIGIKQTMTDDFKEEGFNLSSWSWTPSGTKAFSPSSR